MNEDVINDLKQFIDVTVSQQISEVRDDIKQLDKKLSAKIDDLSESVAEALTTSNEDVDGQLKDHETRIITLEAKST
jgi:cell division septum initiation protein DivIVA